jgi:metallo-beta-lactamase class B
MRLSRFASLALLIGLTSTPVMAQSDSAYRAWNEPVAPFQILDNLYYVGAREITSFLVTTPAGHILIDGGFDETAPQIEANIRTLGFDPRDIRVLLNSQAHFDHAGGLARLRELTGAALYASPADAELMARGGKGDFAFGDGAPYPAVRADSLLRDGQAITLGGTRLVARFTPGHTKGCTTFTADLRDGRAVRQVVFMCSLTAPGYRLTNNAEYPSILQDYARSIALVRRLRCDVLLASHGSFFDLEGKRSKLAAERAAGRNPFVRRGECRALADDAEASLRAAVQREQGS